ncbi:MAG: hypothetical protein V3T86_13845 [Planctomycetota bacterium]
MGIRLCFPAILMMASLALVLAPLAARPTSAEETPKPAPEPEPARARPIYNVDLTDVSGREVSLVAFSRLSPSDHFVGYKGSAHIEVPYSKVREFRLQPPQRPGARRRAKILLRSGNEIEASFDEREGELLFSGYAQFGRVRIFFRDIRLLRIRGETRKEDFPRFGKPAAGVDARIVDRQGVSTELVGFRRRNGENVFQGIFGSMTIEVPLRIIKSVVMKPDEKLGKFAARVQLTGGKFVEYHVPTYEEKVLYGGDAEFGDFRLTMGDIRRLDVHRVTPRLSRVDPLRSAGEESPPGATPPRPGKQR